MLRRNFLKLVSLAPFTGTITSLVEAKQKDKWYAIVQLHPSLIKCESIGYSVEVLLEDGCIPIKYEAAIIKDGGVVGSYDGSGWYVTVGIFITERYQKNA